MNQLESFYVSQYDRVVRLLREDLDDRLVYHNAQHTLNIIRASQEIGLGEGLDSEELLIVKIAALFHDIGYLVEMNDNEVFAVEIFQQAAKGVCSESHIALISACIMATKIPQSPKSKLECVLCDADLDYLGSDQFNEISELLYQELLAFGEIQGRNEWNQLQIQFLTQRSYHSEFAKRERSERLKKNLNRLKQETEA